MKTLPDSFKRAITNVIAEYAIQKRFDVEAHILSENIMEYLEIVYGYKLKNNVLSFIKEINEIDTTAKDNE